ncbi:MAG: PAS domain S-box protein, partial [Pseudomonadota bacterium]|nr:PAS domain S-box protein [Pseudomonadota bacterium]
MAEPYRIMLVGSREDLERLSAPLAAGPGRFELALSEPGGEGQLTAGIAAEAPDVAVIGATVERPLPLAQQVRTRSPKSQIVFLLPADQVDSFRAKLPFVPHLGSAWTASMAADASTLAGLIGDAARAARERAANRIVLGRINQQLAARATAPAHARRSQLALSERYLATILTQSPDAFLAVDRDGAVIAHNDAAERLFGAAVEKAYETGAAGLFPEQEREKVLEALRRGRSGETLAGVEVQLGDGSPGYAELALAPVHDESGAIASVSITARDITERRRSEEHQHLLINELNHRVKNTLAIVQALAQQSFRGAAAPEEEKAAFSARLQALAAAHNLLTLQSWQPIALGRIAEATVAAACGADAGRVEISGPEVVLPAQTAVSAAMALHELTTNAIKYGALSNETGRVTFAWRVVEAEDGPR